MKYRGFLVGLGLGLFLSATPAARAGVTVYTNRVEWETAVGGGTGDIMDDFNSGTMTRAKFTISGVGLPIFPNANAQTTIDGSGYFRATLNSSGNYAVFTFTNLVTALGYDLNPQGSDIGKSVQIALDGTSDGGYTLPSTDVNAFVGIVSTVPFTAYKITTPDTSAWHGIDHFEAFSVVPVPEPSLAALAALGVGCLSLVRRRRAPVEVHGERRR